MDLVDIGSMPGFGLGRSPSRQFCFSRQLRAELWRAFLQINLELAV